MYRIYADNLCIFDDTLPEQQHMAVSPKLSLTAGAAGSLTFTLPKGCTGYDTVQKLVTTIRVERDFDTIWMGRVLTEKIDLWGSRELFCEGALAFLNDTIPMVDNPSIASVITAHNGKTVSGGAVRPMAYNTNNSRNSQTVTAEKDGSNSLEIINSKIVGAEGGILQVTYPSNVPTLDWLAAYPTNVNAQKLEFGKNLLDFTRNWDLTEYSTYCYVQGAEYETTVNDQTVKQNYNSGWVTVGDAASYYGRIEKFLNYSDLTDPADCVAEAQKYLATQQFDNMMLELTALDLHIIDPAIRPFHLLEIVSVSSWAHGMSPQNFAVTAMEIPLDAPENTRYTLANATLAYTRKVRTITKVTQQNLSESIEYADTAADGALSAANDHTDAVKVVLEAKDTEIEASVTAADGKASEAKITADEIKGKVTDAQGNYTVANLKADGFHIADAQGVTLITGTMIDVDTIHVNKLYGGTIYLMVDEQTQAGSFYAEAAGGPNPSALTINFQSVTIAPAGSVILPDVRSIGVYNNGVYTTLAALLGIQ